MEYLVIIEEGKNNYSAYLPDVPGCVATGKTREETIKRLTHALKMHIQGLKEDGLSVPTPITKAEYIAISQ